MKAAERRDLLAQREWWSRIAVAYGMELRGWNGWPPSSASFMARQPYEHVVEIDGTLAQAMYEMAVKAGVIVKDAPNAPGVPQTAKKPLRGQVPQMRRSCADCVPDAERDADTSSSGTDAGGIRPL